MDELKIRQFLEQNKNVVAYGCGLEDFLSGLDVDCEDDKSLEKDIPIHVLIVEYNGQRVKFFIREAKDDKPACLVIHYHGLLEHIPITIFPTDQINERIFAVVTLDACLNYFSKRNLRDKGPKDYIFYGKTNLSAFRILLSSIWEEFILDRTKTFLAMACEQNEEKYNKEKAQYGTREFNKSFEQHKNELALYVLRLIQLIKLTNGLVLIRRKYRSHKEEKLILECEDLCFPRIYYERRDKFVYDLCVVLKKYLGSEQPQREIYAEKLIKYLSENFNHLIERYNIVLPEYEKLLTFVNNAIKREKIRENRLGR